MKHTALIRGALLAATLLATAPLHRPGAGARGREFIEATPLAEDGFLYITDSFGVLYKIDATAGDVGRIVWRMDPKQEKQGISRGAALWGNFVISPASWPARIMATDKETGQVVWE